MPAPAMAVTVAAAWVGGAILAVATPGWPFPGAPLMILLSGALAWRLATPGHPRPAAWALAVATAFTAVCGVSASLAWVTGRVGSGYAVAAWVTAALVSSLFCLSTRNRSDGQVP